MTSHLRANLVLVAATLLLCSVVYPLVVWVAACALPSKATGGIVSVNGQPVGAELIAQEFKQDEYFQPRPSATSPAYNASASGASNYGANNPKLRARVARQLGSLVAYRDGQPVGPDVEKWFNDQPGRLADWATRYPKLAKAWLNSDSPTTDAVAKWLEEHDSVVAAWKENHAGASKDLVFFAVFSEGHPGKVPSVVENKIIPAGSADVQGWFFEMWLQAHPERAADLEPVPADMVTTSGSGLDPHITLRNARYQLKRVAAAWVRKNRQLNESKVEEQLRPLLNDKAFTPLLGFSGEPLVNVLEVNLALRERFSAAK